MLSSDECLQLWHYHFMKKFIILFIFMFSACASEVTSVNEQLVPDVDIERFVGKWYVIAHLPTFLETKAYNAIEEYTYKGNGEIDVNYHHREGAFDGKVKKIPQTAILTENPANWKIKLWLFFKFDYLIIDLADDYRYTAVGVPNKKYVWIMSRTPTMSKEDYQKVYNRIKTLGYDVNSLRLVPQKWD